jgi:predicted transcriptional regulator of viral defense system
VLNYLYLKLGETGCPLKWFGHSHLLRTPEIDTTTAARLAQQSESDARQTLSRMETEFGYLERGGTGRGTYWILRRDLHHRISASGHPERDRWIDWEAAKTRVLTMLMERAKRGERGLSNEEIRQTTHYDRNQARRLVVELMAENPDIKQLRRTTVGALCVLPMSAHSITHSIDFYARRNENAHSKAHSTA